jgi:thioredoxin-related protein
LPNILFRQASFGALLPILGVISAACSEMRNLILLIILICTQLLRGQGLEWTGDLEAAKETAKQENKFVLLYFSGSDWCPTCKKLKAEVFDQPDFADFARAKFVFVEADLPRYKPIGHLQLQANKALEQSFHVASVPTVVVLTPDGQEMHRFGYVPGGPAGFISQLGPIAKAQIVRPPPPAREPEPRRRPVTFTPIPPEVPNHYGALALKSISGTKDRRMVLINNASMLAGETAKVKVEDHDVTVCCKEIRDDSVLITCNGKEMELKLGKE